MKHVLCMFVYISATYSACPLLCPKLVSMMTMMMTDGGPVFFFSAATSGYSPLHHGEI
jgi:hypothetical protein